MFVKKVMTGVPARLPARPGVSRRRSSSLCPCEDAYLGSSPWCQVEPQGVHTHQDPAGRDPARAAPPVDWALQPWLTWGRVGKAARPPRCVWCSGLAPLGTALPAGGRSPTH